MSIFASSDLIRARERIQQHAWAAQIFAAVRSRADKWMRHPTNVPVLSGGWVHDYICPEHWSALVFDQGSPHAHPCPAGETRTGDKLDAAWRVLEHRRMANAARDLGLVYALSDAIDYADAARVILMQYAGRYSSYAGADHSSDWMLSGRVFAQALTEALWTTPIVHAYDFVRPALAPDQDAQIITGLLRPLAETMMNAQDELAHRQKNLKSNYNAWLIAAIGLLGYVLNDQALVARAIDGDAGFRTHLAVAILSDGFEYEGTPYYHNFVALAYSILAQAARANGRDLYAERSPKGQSIESMWHALASLAYADGSIPAINDGAYHTGGAFAREIGETYEIAFARTREPMYAWLLNATYARVNELAGQPALSGDERGDAAMDSARRGGWAALLFAEQDIADAAPPHQSVCLHEVGIAVLRNEKNPMQVCVPFGAYAGSHSHLDPLAPQIFPFATDPGTPLYGISARNDWYQQTAAHNAIVVDGKSQARGSGQVAEWKNGTDATVLRLASDELFAGVKLERTFTLSKGSFVDRAEVESSEKHTFDWIVHIDGECHLDGANLRPMSGPLADEGAFRFASVSAHGCAQSPRGRNEMSHVVRATIEYSGKTFALAISASEPAELIVGTTPAHVRTPLQTRQMLVVRTRGCHAAFLAQYEWIP